eukprot:6183558-Pleurochrysis_carterae.AAC.4
MRVMRARAQIRRSTCAEACACDPPLPSFRKARREERAKRHARVSGRPPGRLARDHLVEQHAKGPDVDRLTALQHPDNLWRHVLSRPDQHLHAQA